MSPWEQAVAAVSELSGTQRDLLRGAVLSELGPPVTYELTSAVVSPGAAPTQLQIQLQRRTAVAGVTLTAINTAGNAVAGWFTRLGVGDTTQIYVWEGDQGAAVDPGTAGRRELALGALTRGYLYRLLLDRSVTLTALPFLPSTAADDHVFVVRLEGYYWPYDEQVDRALAALRQLTAPVD